MGLALIGLGPTRVTWDRGKSRGVSLEKYRQKRSADRTPEPFGGRAPDRPHLFVVQKHAATPAPLRLPPRVGRRPEVLGGPAGPLARPAEKRLAVEVEDHPVEYADFEGVIPEGNYGAGEVIVWDQGRWTPLGDLEEGMKKGKLLFELHGYKLRGEWTLVRMKTKGKTDRQGVAPHQGARRLGAQGHRRPTTPQESIFSGLTLEELASGREPRGRDPGASSSALEAPRRRGPRVAAVELMLAEPRDDAVLAAGLALRAQVRRLPPARGARGRRGAPALPRTAWTATATFPEIARALRGAARSTSLVLDGEVVVLDEKARPRFGRLQKRALLQRRPDIERAAVELPATLFVFDLLGFEDFDLRGAAAARRARRSCSALLPRAGPAALRRPRRGAGRGPARSRPAGSGSRAIVGKKADSPYRGGRSADWVKVRARPHRRLRRRRLHAARGRAHGLRRPAPRRRWRDGGLVYAGRVGTGFTEKQLARDPRAPRARAARQTPACARPGAHGHAATSGSSPSSSARCATRSGPARGCCATRSSCASARTSRRRSASARTARDRSRRERRRRSAAAPARRRTRRRSSPSPTSTRSSGPRRATPRAT